MWHYLWKGLVTQLVQLSSADLYQGWLRQVIKMKDSRIHDGLTWLQDEFDLEKSLFDLDLNHWSLSESVATHLDRRYFLDFNIQPCSIIHSCKMIWTAMSHNQWLKNQRCKINPEKLLWRILNASTLLPSCDGRTDFSVWSSYSEKNLSCIKTKTT